MLYQYEEASLYFGRFHHASQEPWANGPCFCPGHDPRSVEFLFGWEGGSAALYTYIWQIGFDPPPIYYPDYIQALCIDLQKWKHTEKRCILRCTATLCILASFVYNCFCLVYPVKLSFSGSARTTWKGMLKRCKTMRNIQSRNLAWTFYWTFSLWTPQKMLSFRGWLKVLVFILVCFFNFTFLFHPFSSISFFHPCKEFFF